VPPHVAKDLTPEQIRTYRIADNKTAKLSDWNYDLLPIETYGEPDNVSPRSFPTTISLLRMDWLARQSAGDVSPQSLATTISACSASTRMNWASTSWVLGGPIEQHYSTRTCT
jgi:hypothetical protein